MPKRTRIVLIFLLGIVLPSLLLGYLAFRGVQNDRALLEKSKIDAHRSIAQEVNQKVDESLSASEFSLQEFLSVKKPYDSSTMIRLLEDLKTSHPLIQETFAIQRGRSLKFVGASLLYRLKEDLNPQRLPSPNPSIDRLLQRGERLEFQNQDFKEASDVYQQALGATSDPHIQADLLRKIARVQKKSRQFKEAIETYQTIAEKHSQIWITEGIPLGLASQLEIGSLLIDMEDRGEAQEVYMGLYRSLISGQWLLEKESHNFYSDRLQKSIAENLTQVSLPEGLQSLRKSFQELVEEENRKKEETERLLLFQQSALAKRELMVLQSMGGFPEGNKRFTIEIGASQYLVSLLGKSPADNETWGFLVDDHYLAESLLPEIIQGLAFPEETDWIIRERNGKAVLASNDTPSGSLTFESDFIGDFPDWTLEFYQADPRLLDAFLTSRRGIYFYMFILIAGILVFGLILTIRSLTREMELSRMKSDFVSTVSHEFKSPLTSIRQIAEMLHSGRVPSEERRQKYYDVLLEQSERLSLLTDNVLSFARMEEGKREFVFEPVDLDNLLSNIVSTVQDRVKHDGFTIEAKIEKSLPSVMADASAFTQAISNLIDNAVKYSGELKKVVLQAFNEEQRVVVQVIDFGVGIEKNERDKIFDRFYRGGDELTRTVKGSGLGLTLVKQIVEAHKGTVHVESEPGRGSVFTIKLPLDQDRG